MSQYYYYYYYYYYGQRLIIATLDPRPCPKRPPRKTTSGEGGGVYYNHRDIKLIKAQGALIRFLH